MRDGNRSGRAAFLLIGLLILQIIGGLSSPDSNLEIEPLSKHINSSLTDNGDGTTCDACNGSDGWGTWLLDIIGEPNQEFFIDVNGYVTGSTSILIPYQGGEITKAVLFSVDMTEWLDEEGSTGLNVFSVSRGDQMQVRGGFNAWSCEDASNCIMTRTPGTNILQVGAGSTLFALDAAGNLNVSGVSTFVDVNVSGTVTANAFKGDGSALTDLNVSAAGWTNTVSGASSITYNTYLNFVGIGTTNPRYMAEVGPVGASNTTLYVNGSAFFKDQLDAKNVRVTGIITASNLDVASGNLTIGILTATNIKVGGSSTILATTTSGAGIGTVTPRAGLDVVGHTRLQAASNEVRYLEVESNQIKIYLNEASTFICTVTDDISRIRLYNADQVVNTSQTFTLKLTQNSTGGYGVGINTIHNGDDDAVSVYWPGGVVPEVTTTASKSDIYSFNVFDGYDLDNQGIFGVITGQNFTA